MIKWRGISFGMVEEYGCSFTIRGISTSRHDSRALMKLVSKDRENITPVEDFFKIKRVIFNAPATIVLWEDGTKTVVQCRNEDNYDEEKGLAMCIAKKALGNTGRYYDTFKKYEEENKPSIDGSWSEILAKFVEPFTKELQLLTETKTEVDEDGNVTETTEAVTSVTDNTDGVVVNYTDIAGQTGETN